MLHPRGQTLCLKANSCKDEFDILTLFIATVRIARIQQINNWSYGSTAVYHQQKKSNPVKELLFCR